jgi:type II secretory ATPase GspE/PulE/Tfp pilus assembly ATPase PilB-like protein
VIQEAVNRGASDIHFEPGPECGRIRFRIDGDMYPYASDVLSERMEHLVNALADMANVNSYALPHAPCDAAINRRLALPDGRAIKTTLRFASCPALYGVDVTLRLNINQFFDFQEIGFEEQQLADIFAALKHKNGVILVTGETGSGKSNTLEAIIRHLEAGDARKVIQVGDPIEFPNAKRTQIQIKAGCDWDQALKISLRKDPNIFSPGEFRDEKEARMVFRAGRTGHLVPTTVHTNDVATTFDRLSDLGVEPYHQGPSIRLGVSQRLIKKLCAGCKTPDPLAHVVARQLLAVLFPNREDLQGMEIIDDERPWLYRAAGCPACYGTGYRGRTIVAEVLRMTNDLARMISRGAKGDVVVDYAVRENNMMPLAEAAARKLVSGVTSFNEVEHLLSEEVKRRGGPKARTTTAAPVPAEPPASASGGEQTEETINAIDAEYADILTDDEWPLDM